jgi:hypothetical protein
VDKQGTRVKLIAGTVLVAVVGGLLYLGWDYQARLALREEAMLKQAKQPLQPFQTWSVGCPKCEWAGSGTTGQPALVCPRCGFDFVAQTWPLPSRLSWYLSAPAPKFIACVVLTFAVAGVLLYCRSRR